MNEAKSLVPRRVAPGGRRKRFKRQKFWRAKPRRAGGRGACVSARLPWPTHTTDCHRGAEGRASSFPAGGGTRDGGLAHMAMMACASAGPVGQRSSLSLGHAAANAPSLRHGAEESHTGYSVERHAPVVAAALGTIAGTCLAPPPPLPTQTRPCTLDTHAHSSRPLPTHH